MHSKINGENPSKINGENPSKINGENPVKIGCIVSEKSDQESVHTLNAYTVNSFWMYVDSHETEAVPLSEGVPLIENLQYTILRHIFFLLRCKPTVDFPCPLQVLQPNRELLT